MLKFLTHKLRTHSLNEESVSEKVEERDSGTESDDDAAPPGDFCTDVIMKWNDVTDISMGGEACACAPAPPRLLPEPEPDHLYDHHSSEEELEVINGAPRGAEGAGAAAGAGGGGAGAAESRRRGASSPPPAAPEKRKWPAQPYRDLLDLAPRPASSDDDDTKVRGDPGAVPHVTAAGGTETAARGMLVWGGGHGCRRARGCGGTRRGGPGGARTGPAVAAAPAPAAATSAPSPTRARLRQDAAAEGGRRRAVVARGGRRARRRAVRLLLVMPARSCRTSARRRPRRPRTAAAPRPRPACSVPPAHRCVPSAGRSVPPTDRSVPPVDRSGHAAAGRRPTSSSSVNCTLIMIKVQTYDTKGCRQSPLGPAMRADTFSKNLLVLNTVFLSISLILD